MSWKRPLFLLACEPGGSRAIIDGGRVPVESDAFGHSRLAGQLERCTPAAWLVLRRGRLRLGVARLRVGVVEWRCRFGRRYVRVGMHRVRPRCFIGRCDVVAAIVRVQPGRARSAKAPKRPAAAAYTAGYAPPVDVLETNV